jgi:hypothetical protein
MPESDCDVLDHKNLLTSPRTRSLPQLDQPTCTRCFSVKLDEDARASLPRLSPQALVAFLSSLRETPVPRFLRSAHKSQHSLACGLSRGNSYKLEGQAWSANLS